jgi:hypothetical protein
MMHLVYVTGYLPAEGIGATRDLADRAVVAGLRRAGARVTHLGLKRAGAALLDSDNSASLGEIDTVSDDAPVAKKLRNIAASVLAGMPLDSARLHGACKADVAAVLARLQPFDGLVLAGTDLAGAFETIFTRHPFVFVAREAAHVAAKEAAARSAGVAERMLLKRDVRGLEALQRRLCESARGVVTFCAEDRAALGLEDSGKAHVAPFVMPEPPGEYGLRFPAFDVGLAGTWTDPRSRLRLEWFLQRVVPKLHPHMMIAVAGRTPPRFPIRDKRVFFLGAVDDRADFLRQCRVVALPERSETGIPVAAAEAFELGLPAVATAQALRGIADPPANVSRVDGANGFAKAVEAQALGQRTATVEDCDGEAFRNERLARMDAVVAAALGALAG